MLVNSRNCIALAMLILLASLNFVLFWPAAWWNPAVFAIERAGGRVTFLTNCALEGRAAVVLPQTTTDEELENMGALDRLAPVWVQVPNSAVGNRGLASLKRLGELRGLSLLGTKVDDDGLVHLDAWAHLEVLVLDKCPITDRGLEQLKSQPRLRVVTLVGTEVTREGVERLQAACPMLQVSSAYSPDDD